MPSRLVLKDIGKLLLLVLAAAPLLLSGCRKREIVTNRVENPIVIDGDMQEWAGLENTYLKNEKALLGLSNDDENLYIMLRFGEPSWMNAFMMGHLTVWVDTEGRRNRDLGFRYSGGITPRDMTGGRGGMPGREGMTGREGAPGRGGRRPATPERPAILEVVTGGEEQARRIALDGSEGPEAKAGIAGGILTLEFSIPMAGRSEGYYGVDISPGDEFSIGFDLKVDRELLTQQLPQGGTAGGGGMPGRGGGGIVGGGRMPGGGMGGGMSPVGTSSPSEQKIWIRTALAEPEK